MNKDTMADDLWDTWFGHYEDTKVKFKRSEFNRDGIIDKDAYDKAAVRVLFVLKETNEFEDNDKYHGDIRLFLADGARLQIWHTVARWAAGIQQNAPNYEKIDHPKIFHDALIASAVINLKKIAGSRDADMSKVNAYAFNDRKLLRRQIAEIDPDVIVAGGTFDTLIWLLDLPCDPNKPHGRAVIAKEHNWRVIPMRHPARVVNKVAYEKLQRKCKELLKRGYSLSR